MIRLKCFSPKTFFILPVVALCSFQLFAADAIQVIESADHKMRMYSLNKVSASQATFSFFHASIPEDGVVTVALEGADKFKSSPESLKGTSTGVKIELHGNTAFIKVEFIGQTSVGLATECGTSISVLIDVHSHKEPKKATESLNKVAVMSPEGCVVNKAS